MHTDRLTCRSPQRCPSCEHWQGSACALEQAIAEAFAPRAPAIAVVTRPLAARA